MSPWMPTLLGSRYLHQHKFIGIIEHESTNLLRKERNWVKGVKVGIRS